VPEVLLEIMVLCYRMLFVFSEAVRDTDRAGGAPRLRDAAPGTALARQPHRQPDRADLAAGARLHVARRRATTTARIALSRTRYANTHRDLWIAGGGAG
jgi:cobalt/nickel transport system permease protein